MLKVRYQGGHDTNKGGMTNQGMPESPLPWAHKMRAQALNNFLATSWRYFRIFHTELTKNNQELDVVVPNNSFKGGI